MVIRRDIIWGFVILALLLLVTLPELVVFKSVCNGGVPILYVVLVEEKRGRWRYHAEHQVILTLKSDLIHDALSLSHLILLR